MKTLIRYSPLLILALGWELVARLQLISSDALPPLSGVVSAWVDLVRDGDLYRVNGQKIWTSLADHAKFGILIARTRNDVSKHRGISYFIISMDLPGIEVRPIRNMTGASAASRIGVGSSVMSSWLCTRHTSFSTSTNPGPHSARSSTSR